MRVLFTTTGFSGHLLPLVPFARAYVRAGHDVLFAVPDSKLDGVARLGLPAAEVDDPPAQEVERRMAALAPLTSAAGHPRVIAEGFARGMTRAALPRLLGMVDDWRPDLIVRESYEFGGALAAELSGIPVARVGLGLAAAEEEVVALAAAPVDEFRAQLGLTPDPAAQALRASPYLTLVPPSFEDPDAALPATALRFREPHGTAMEMPDWWPGNRDPVVYATLGSVAGSLPLYPRVYRDVIDALADLRARVLLTIGNDGDPADLGPLPANVHVERWVPQDQVAAHADAVLCHGGYGSVLGALRHGLPQVVLPLFAGDQWRNAERVHRSGAGIAVTGTAGGSRRALDPPPPDALAELPAALRRVLDEPRFTQAAVRMAREIDDLPPIDAAPGLLAAVAPPPLLSRCA